MEASPARAFAALLALPATAGNVWVVDPAGGGNVTQVQAAVALAADGDTLLVKAGYYDGFVVSGKSLQVVAETSGGVVFTGTVVVRDVPAGGAVVLAGLRGAGQYASQEWEGHGLFLADSPGSIRVQQCTFQGSHSVPAPGPRHGARVEDCRDVAFTSSMLVGGAGQWHSGDRGGSGLCASGSNVALFEGQLRGGRGGDAWVPFEFDGQAGGHGYLADDGFVHAAGAAFLPGAGGDGYPAGVGSDPPDGGDGGDGLRLTGPAARAEVLECVFQPGAGGLAGAGTATCPACPGLPGAPGHALLPWRRDQVTRLAGTRRSLFVTTPVREQAGFWVHMQGAPGDEVFLLVAPQARFESFAPWNGVLLTIEQPLQHALVLGPVDPFFSNFSLWATAPDLGPGVQTERWFLQSLHRTAQGAWRLGGTASVVVLDAAF